MLQHLLCSSSVVLCVMLVLALAHPWRCTCACSYVMHYVVPHAAVYYIAQSIPLLWVPSPYRTACAVYVSSLRSLDSTRARVLWIHTHVRTTIRTLCVALCARTAAVYVRYAAYAVYSKQILRTVLISVHVCITLTTAITRNTTHAH